MLRPILFAIFIRLDAEFRRVRDGHERHPAPLELLQPGAGPLVVLVDAEDLDAVAAARHVQSPVPRAPHERRLRVERVVPTPDDQLGPTLGVEGEVHVPCPPGELVLPGKVLRGNLVPQEAPVGTDLDAFGPPAAAAVGPSFDCDQPVVHDHLFRPGLHDRAADRHLLDLYAARVELVVLPDLAVEVQILPRLDRRGGGVPQRLDAVQPLHGAGADVP